jgi:hypothetical protein
VNKEKGFIRDINHVCDNVLRVVMNQKLLGMLVVIVVLLPFSYLSSHCLPGSYSWSYQLLDSPNGSVCYSLNVAVSQSLYEYYYEKSHRLGSNLDFAKFVTPHALQPVADSLWEIYTDEEGFANGVLMIVHQIPYNETLPVKYPVETIAENQGDCDLFSYVAASIMKAGGLDVVLLYYESEAHMNVGISLPSEPQDVRGEAYYVTFNDVQYYVAECTGDNWRSGWRVGECPEGLRHAFPNVITLEDCEQWSPGQVSASYETLASSRISLIVSATTAILGSTVALSGQLSPLLQYKMVTIYIKINNQPWTFLGTVETNSNGQFAYAWNPEVAGVLSVRASWSGDSDYAGDDSAIHNVMVFSVFFIFLLAITVILVSVGMVILLMSRRSQQEVSAPQPPEISL